MKTYLAPIFATAFMLSACDQSAKLEAQRLAEERAAIEREKAALAAEKAAAQQSANEAERMRLEAERAALEREKASAAQQREAQAEAERAARLAAEREKRMAAEQQAAREAAARREAEAREKAARDAAEQARLAAEEARTTQTVAFFYEALDPHGDWVRIDRYGYAFRPNVARDPRWRPYTIGGWVFTDYGWTWRSEEPFGWATYHYGRWARVPRLGWVWVPGSEWGPAWVSWRRSDAYIGWAPLPPDAWSSSGFNAAVDSYFDIGPGLYVFLRVADFGERSYVGRVVAPEQNVTIINQTVNVTKVVYKTVQNKVTIVNHGPDLEAVNKSSRRPIERLAVERVAQGAPQPAKVEAGVLKIAAPEIKAAPPSAQPKVVKEEVKATDLDHGWREAKEQAQKVREAAKKEAHRAEEAERTTPPAPTDEAKPKREKPSVDREKAEPPKAQETAPAKPAPAVPARPVNKEMPPRALDSQPPERKPPGKPAATPSGRREGKVPLKQFQPAKPEAEKATLESPAESKPAGGEAAHRLPAEEKRAGEDSTAQ
jgi:hypothetical protein